MNVAELTNVSRIYGKNETTVHALSDISLTIGTNCFTVLSGPSGSGKTTILNLIGGIDKADAGKVVVAGVDIDEMTDNAKADFRARHVGFIFQSFNLLQVLTAEENIEYPLVLLGEDKEERKARVDELLTAVGLQGRGKRRPAELSGGQRQRVAIARALIARPDIVLADEPTANLDSGTGRDILRLMRELQERYETSFVFSSHDAQVISLADRVVKIRDGALVDIADAQSEVAKIR